jgi:small ribosomal subunit Rsm22
MASTTNGSPNSSVSRGERCHRNANAMSDAMTWETLDWPALERLREGFLSGTAAKGAYWKSDTDLAAYDFTYGERIGWKWDQVLRELRLRGWTPSSRRVFDWGCGSGIAGRRVIGFFGADRFDELLVWDHSAAACEFAAAAAERSFPTLRVASATPGFLDSSDSIGLLVISHVLNELSAAHLAELCALIHRADNVLWVEPGTSSVSRTLGGLRDELRSTFRIIAPCTHELGCPIFTPENERHWCHFFAPPPSEIFGDSNWVKFGQRAGIDLRSLPYSFIALERLGSPVAAAESQRSPRAGEVEILGIAAASAAPEPGLSRVIGRPEHFKPYARLLNCDATGLHELELPKRSDPALFKQLERTKAPLVYRWWREDHKIVGGESLAAGEQK